MSNQALPVWQLQADIVRALTTGSHLVLVAATGSGKTTQVPPMLLDAGVAGNKRIVVLQPRRVAARAVATRVAWERGGKLGGEVGYQVRFEQHLSPETRLCFVTEGILLRWLQNDPDLRDVGTLIFDEFHERNLLSDVTLALAKRLQQTTRPDLKVVVMSATLEAEPVVHYLTANPEHQPKVVSASASTPAPRNDELPQTTEEFSSAISAALRFQVVGEGLQVRSTRQNPGSISEIGSTANLATAPSTPAPILVSEGRAFPVSIRWAEYGDQRPVAERALQAVEGILHAGLPGDILVFMPGKAEIHATINALRSARLAENCVLLPLHGELGPDEQDRAFQRADRRKIIVATNVAETSVTIDGVCHVVDSGTARIARYDAERGIQTLAIEDISRASADQRAGRAGRTAPGTCWRLWTESHHLGRPAKNTPEILRADLAETVLLLHSLGVQQAAEFDWLDRPDPEAVERSERLLTILGALETSDESSAEGDDPACAKERRPPGRRRGIAGAEPTADPETTIDNRSGASAESNSRSASTPAERSAGLQPVGRDRGRGAVQDYPETIGNCFITELGRQMLRLPMHPRYARMLVEASRRRCVPEAALCAALVSGRDLLMRPAGGAGDLKEARATFEENPQSDFHTLLRAHEFARERGFDVHACQRMGIHAQTARQVEETAQQFLQIAQREGLLKNEGLLANEGLLENTPAGPTAPTNRTPDPDALAKCLLAGFIDQLAARVSPTGLEFQLTEGRAGTLVRESVVTAPLAVMAGLREVDARPDRTHRPGRTGPVCLLSLATAVEPAWIAEMFPQHLTSTLDHVFDAAHKRVAAIRQERCLGLIIGQKHVKELDPAAAGRALAEAYVAGHFELPNLGHDVKQFMARVNLVCTALPELEFPPFDPPALVAALARAFHGIGLVKDAQSADLRPAFRRHLEKVQLEWLDELLPLSIPWPEGQKVKLSYPETGNKDSWPSAQVKLTACRDLKDHPRLCEGKVPVKLVLLLPDGKRLDETTDFPQWKTTIYPKHRPALRAKYPSVLWP